MLKKKTSKKQGLSSKNIVSKKVPKQFAINLNHPGIERFSPTENLLNEEILGQVIWECLKNNDAEGVVEAIQAHIEAKQVLEEQKKTKKYKFPTLTTKNPSLKTLTSIIHASVAYPPSKRTLS